MLKTELIGIEENKNTLKISFKTTTDEPLVLDVNNQIFALTENIDIYEITFDMFPVVILDYTMKNAFTEKRRVTTDRYVIDIDTVGFRSFDEFKQFVLRYPTYIRFLELVYRIFSTRPWLFLLYTSTISYKSYNYVRISEHEIEITIEKVSIKTIFKEYYVNNKVTLKLLNKNDNMLLSVVTPIVNFGNTITYNDVVKILEERPNVILNILIMLIITLLD